MTTSTSGRITEHVEGLVVAANDRGVKLASEDGYRNFSKWTAEPIAPPVRGANVRLGLDASGFVRELQVIDAAPATSSSSTTRDREIRRQVAIKTAAQLVGAFAQMHPEVRTEHIFPLADRILDWLEQKGGDES